MNEVELRLEEYRAEVAAEDVVLITYDRYVVLQTLCLVATSGGEYGRKLSTSLSDAPFRMRSTSVINPLWDDSRRIGPTGYLQVLAEPSRYQGSEAPEFFRLLNTPPSPWRMVGGPTRDSRLTVNVLVLQRGGEAHRQPSIEHDLLTQVNGTSNASVHRDRIVTGHVQRSIDDVSRSKAPRLEHLVPSLVSMARRVTQSAAVALFARTSASSLDGDSDHGLQATAVDMESGINLLVGRWPVEGYYPAPLIAHAFDAGTPLLLPGSGMLVSRPTWSDVDAGSIFEIAVPVPSGPVGGTRQSQGVLTLCRRPPAEPFGNYELALLRNVVLRIAMLTQARVTDEAARIVGQSARKYAVAEPQLDSLRQNKTSSPAIGVARPPSARLPSLHFYEDVLGSIKSVLSLAARMSGASLVSFSAIGFGGKRGAAYIDPVIQRVTSWPLLADNIESTDILRMDEVPAPIGAVVTDGRLVHVRDTASPPPDGEEGYRRKQYWPKQKPRALICAPVHVDGRLIGVLEMLTRTPHGFAFQEGVAEACAGQLAISISAERRSRLRDVLSVGSDVQAASHELAGIKDSIDARIPDTSEDERSFWEDTSKGLNQIIAALASPEERAPSSEWSLSELITKAARAAGVYQFRDFQVPFEYVWDTLFERRLFLVLSEVFKNVEHHGEIDLRGLPSLFTRQYKLGGYRYLSIEVANSHRLGLLADVRDLYQRPIHGADRVHFGAFLAGSIMRSLGGDITSTILRGQQMLTVVHVPIMQAS